MNQPIPRTVADVRQGMAGSKVYVVAAQYYLDDGRLGDRMAWLKSELAAVGFESSFHVVDLRPASLPPGEMTRRHPFLDISGYRAGLAGWEGNGIVLLLNDTLFAKHPWKLLVRKLKGLLPLLAAISVPAATGVVHPTTGLLMIDRDNPTRQHLSTFMAAMNADGARVFADIVNGLPGEEDPTGRTWLAAQQAKFPALVPLVEAHLGGSANPWAWHGMRSNPEPQLVQRKAVTVAVEYLFTCQLLRAQGCVLPMNASVRFKFEAMLGRLLQRFAGVSS